MAGVYSITLEDTFGDNNNRQIKYRNKLGDIKVIPLSDVWYFEKDGQHYIRIHHNYGVGYIRNSVKQIQRYFQSEGVTLCITEKHIVNLDYVKKMVLINHSDKRYKVYLTSCSKVITASRRKGEDLKRKLREIGQHHKVLNETEKKLERIKNLKTIFIEDDPQQQIIRASNFTGIYDIPLRDFLYATYDQSIDYVQIYTKSSGVLNTKTRLIDIEYQLGGRDILRIHKAYLVNKAYISHISMCKDHKYNKLYYTYIKELDEFLPIAMPRAKKVLEELKGMDIEPLDYCVSDKI